jgi:hypothetical protein
MLTGSAILWALGIRDAKPTGVVSFVLVLLLIFCCVAFGFRLGRAGKRLGIYLISSLWPTIPDDLDLSKAADRIRPTSNQPSPSPVTRPADAIAQKPEC